VNPTQARCPTPSSTRAPAGVYTGSAPSLHLISTRSHRRRGECGGRDVVIAARRRFGRGCSVQSFGFSNSAAFIRSRTLVAGWRLTVARSADGFVQERARPPRCTSRPCRHREYERRHRPQFREKATLCFPLRAATTAASTLVPPGSARFQPAERARRGMLEERCAAVPFRHANVGVLRRRGRGWERGQSGRGVSFSTLRVTPGFRRCRFVRRSA